MKTEDLKAQGLTDEQVAFVMAENGKDYVGDAIAAIAANASAILPEPKLQDKTVTPTTSQQTITADDV